jgi:hypothetical protein
MWTRLAFLYLLACAASLGSACTTAEREHSLDLGRSRQAIVGGSSDTTHDAVVALTLTTPTGTARCSGTVVRVDSGVGTLITAAHCFEEPPSTVTVSFGSDVTAPSSSTVATAWELYPTTTGKLFDDSHDLAAVSFAASATTPVMPIVPPADYLGLAPGAPFLAVGYGRTTSVGGGGLTTARNKLPVALDSFLRTAIETISTSGATCFGDSGGALIDASSGVERLIGVNRAGTSCDAGSQNEATGFFTPEIASWLRTKGLVAPDARQPVGADCTSPAVCASGECHDVLLDYNDAGTAVVSLCGPDTSTSPAPSSSGPGRPPTPTAGSTTPAPVSTQEPAPSEADGGAGAPIVRVSNCAMRVGGDSEGAFVGVALAVSGVVARRRRRAPRV